MSIANIIAEQLDHTKPDNLRPGKDVGFQATNSGLRFTITPMNRTGRVEYDEGMDSYTVTVHDKGEATVVYEDVYADQIGELVWGDNAKDWTLPLVTITSWDEDGNEHTESF